MTSRTRSKVLPDPLSLAGLVADHLEHLRMRNYSEETIRNRKSNLEIFCRWCEERGVVNVADVTRPVVEQYRVWLFHYRQSDGRPLAWSSQIHRLTAVKMYFRWLVRQSYALYSPAAELELPRRPHYLPQAVLTRSEVEQVINQPDVETHLGVRDRAILETLYSTGIRRMELCSLRVEHLDVGREVLLVRQGKGRKDRVVPVGDRALAWLDRYLWKVRPHLVMPPDGRQLFLNDHGFSMSGKRLSKLCGGYVKASGVGKAGACHIFRHTMATHMLEGGADTRFIQQMLGHEHLSTTQIYTRVSIRKLQEVHRRTHPARLHRDGADVEDATEVEDLMATLDAEGEDDEDGTEDLGD